MPDISTTFGFVFSADDQTTPGVERAQAAAESAADALENSLVGLATSADSVIGALGTQMTSLQESNDPVVWEAGPLSFGDAVRGSLPAMELLLITIGSAASRLNEMGSTMMKKGGFFNKLGGSILTSFGNLFGGDGLMGFILGPIGPILTLLSPLISLLSDTLMPIFQDFIGIIQNAFAPLQFVLDTLLQSLIPHIQKLMGPIVAMLTHLAVDLGVQLQQMFGGLVGILGPAMTAIVGLMPALQGIFASIVKIAIKAMPLFIDLLNEVIPVVVELAKVLAESFIARMDIIGKMIEELGPDFVSLIGELLRSLLPLAVEFIKLGDVLLRDVFAPIFIPMLKGAIKLLLKIVPIVSAILKPVAELFTYVIEKLSMLSENWDKFLLAWPEVTKVIDVVKEGFTDMVVWIIGKFNTLVDKAKGLIEWIPGIDFEESENASPPGFADGAIATGSEGVFGQIGEAGTAEAVVPLDRQHLKEFMEPALGDMAMTGLSEQTGLLGALVELGREALSKMDQDRENRSEAGGVEGRYNIEADLTGGVGLGGMVPVGG